MVTEGDLIVGDVGPSYETLKCGNHKDNNDASLR